MKARRIALFATALAVGAAGIGSLPAGATGSATAGNTKTREVGSALASCTQGLGLSTTDLQAQIYKPVPGKGAVLGQSFFFNNLGQAMADRLQAGMTPAEIISRYRAINAQGAPAPAQNHPDAALYEGYTMRERRQYLVSSLDAPSAAHTGQSNEAIVGTPRNRGDQVVSSSAIRGVVGGNTLTSTGFVGSLAAGLKGGDVVKQLETILGEPIAKADAKKLRQNDLAEHLFMSLATAFGQPGQGDWRCVYDTNTPPAAGAAVPAGTRSAGQGWIRVDAANGTTTMNLRYKSLHNRDAVVELARMYKACRLGTGSCFADEFDQSAKVETPSKGLKGRSLLMRDTKRDWMGIDGEGAALKQLPFDPRTTDVSIQVRVDAAGTANDSDVTYTLPKANWKKGTARYDYNDKKYKAGPFSDVRFTMNTGKLSIKGTNGGYGWNLAKKPASVDVIVRAGTTIAYCMHFTSGKYVANKLFQSKNAPAPKNCA